MTPHATEQARVHAAISAHILAFAVQHTRFHMSELTAYVGCRVATAPDSAGRILRALRQEGKLDYRLVSRRDSEYQITAVKHEEPQQAPVSASAGEGQRRGATAATTDQLGTPAASSPNQQLVLV